MCEFFVSHLYTSDTLINARLLIADCLQLLKGMIVHVTTGVAWFWKHFHVSKRLVFVRFNAAYLQALSSERERFCNGRFQLIVLQLPGYLIHLHCGPLLFFGYLIKNHRKVMIVDILHDGVWESVFRRWWNWLPHLNCSCTNLENVKNRLNRLFVRHFILKTVL